MEYLFTDDYRIKITGKPQELKTFIKELSSLLDGGSGYQQIEKKVEGLENIVDMQQYTFGIYTRIYFNNKEVIYTPNASSMTARKFHFDAFMKTFDKIVKNMK